MNSMKKDILITVRVDKEEFLIISKFSSIIGYNKSTFMREIAVRISKYFLEREKDISSIRRKFIEFLKSLENFEVKGK